MDKTVRIPAVKTVVCITDQRRCDRIIRAGRALADVTKTELAVINVVRTNHCYDAASIEYLFSVSRDNGAEMVLLYSEDVAKAIIRYIKDNRVAHLLTGIPAKGDSVTGKIWSKFSHINFFVVEEDGSLSEVGNSVRAARELCLTEPQGA